MLKQNVHPTPGGWEPGAMGKRSQIPDARLTQPFGDLLKWNQLLDGGRFFIVM